MAQVVIKEDGVVSHHLKGACGNSGRCEFCVDEQHEVDRSREEGNGRKLADELASAEHGTTIEIATGCYFPTGNLDVSTSVRLIGKKDGHHIRTWEFPLMVR